VADLNVGEGQDRLLVVTLAGEVNAATMVTSVLWGSQEMTPVVNERFEAGYVSIWTLAEPDSGELPLSVALAEGSIVFGDHLVMGFYSLTGAYTADPVVPADLVGLSQGVGESSSEVLIQFDGLPENSLIIDAAYSNNSGNVHDLGPEQSLLFSMSGGGGSTLSSSYALDQEGDAAVSLIRPGVNRVAYAAVAIRSDVADAGGTLIEMSSLSTLLVLTGPAPAAGM